MARQSSKRQFNRIYELIIGDAKTGDAVSISDLHISLEVVKSSDNKRRHNSAIIEVYNMKDETLRKLETDLLGVQLSVGYLETGLTTLLIGQVVEVTTVRNGEDKVTRLQLGEGFVELNETNLNFLVPPGKTYEDVIEEIRKQMPGISRGSYTGINCKNQVLYGYPLSGTAKEMLNQVCEANRMEWRVDRGSLTVTDESGVADKDLNNAFVLNENTGLIDIPYHTSADGRKLKKDKTRRQGVQFKALLNPRIIPGSIVRLESKLLSGWYKVVTARYTGEYEGQDWYVECFCSEILEDDLSKV